MTIFILILIALSAFLLGFFILIQSPKGGGMGNSIGGVGASFSTQFGVKKANDILERGTYLFIIIIAVLSIISVYTFDGKDTINNTNEIDDLLQAPPAAKPINTQQPQNEQSSPQQEPNPLEVLPSSPPPAK